MNIWANAVMTNKGLALQSKLIAGTALTITKAVTGAGTVDANLLKEQTSVANQKQIMTFRPVSYPETGKCSVPVYLTNESLTTGYTIMQIGIYAQDPDEGEILYFICQAEAGTGTPVPSVYENPGYSAEWTFYFQYGQADAVSVTVDPANTINATQAQQMIDAGVSNAKSYTDQKIAAIPTPDVSGQINTHNNDKTSHQDIRSAIAGKADAKHTHTATDVGALGFKRILTATDDLNNTVEPGIYVYYTGSAPANAPYSNASVVEVIATNSATGRLIQRVTRYGTSGCSSFRPLDVGGWKDWKEFATADSVLSLLGGSKITDCSLNDHKTPGNYYGSFDNVTDGPTGATGSFYLHIRDQYNSGNYIEQELTIGVSFVKYHRRWNGTNWSDWSNPYLLADGSMAMAGNLLIRKNGDVSFGGTDLAGLRDVFYTLQEGMLIISTRMMGDNTNRAAVWFGPETKTLDDILRINVRINNEIGNTYNVLHTGNKNLIYTYGTEDLVAGETPLESGKLYFVYE